MIIFVDEYFCFFSNCSQSNDKLIDTLLKKRFFLYNGTI